MLRYALGSTSELEYHFIAALDIEVIDKEAFVSLVSQVKQVRMMLFGLLKRLDGPDTGSPAKKNARWH